MGLGGEERSSRTSLCWIAVSAEFIQGQPLPPRDLNEVKYQDVGPLTLMPLVSPRCPPTGFPSCGTVMADVLCT